MVANDDIQEALNQYRSRLDIATWCPKCALIDMDGVLYDSMPRHARAWKRMTDEIGMSCREEEFFLYEGMTGAATIDLLFEQYKGRKATPDEIEELYRRKTLYFKEYGERILMPGADKMLNIFTKYGLKCVLVTGSAQSSLIDAIYNDYPGAFEPGMRVCARDVRHGKPHPEPYLRGLDLAGQPPHAAIVVENAPLGVEAGHRSGCFTVGITTGPVPADILRQSGADLVVDSMPMFAQLLPELINS